MAPEDAAGLWDCDILVMVDMVRRCAWYRVYRGTLASLVTLLLPVASLVVPLIILKKMVFGFLFGIGFTEIEIGWQAEL